MLKHLMVEIFNGCNCKCNMCTIWTNKGINIDLLKLENFLKSNTCKTLESIGITGGEPMMSNQLYEIATLINKFDNIKTIYITSNGSFQDRLMKFVKTFKNKMVNINISLDGPEHIHNEIRGINVHNKAIETIKALKESKLLSGLGIKMTVQKMNIEEIDYMYNLANKLKVSFSLMPVVSSDAYFNNIDKTDFIQINPGTAEGDKLLKAITEFKKKMNTPYLNMVTDLYNGKSRDMSVYGCLFPHENNILYADGKLGICFMTDRLDIDNYLDNFNEYEKTDFRAVLKLELLKKECQKCPASCAGNYKIPLIKRILNKTKRIFA